MRRLHTSPLVALLGPRQGGKTTLAKQVVGGRIDAASLGLERPPHLGRLSDPEAYFGRRPIAIACQASSAPKPTRRFWGAPEDLAIDEAYVVAPVDREDLC